MYNFYSRNKTFLAIIIGAVIIGGFVYFGLEKEQPVKNTNVITRPKTEVQSKQQNLTPSLKINSAPVVSTATCGAAINTIVTKVIDGDTVVVEGGWHVRLLGMDADEKGYPCYDPARIRLENLVLGKQVTLEKDKSDVDQYGRCLRYIFSGAANIDTQLVAEGLAVARFYEPDVKYRTEITAAEQQAQTGGIGCKWSGAAQTATK